MSAASVLILAAALAAGPGAAPPADRALPRSPAVYPERRVTLAFSHRGHRGQARRCLGCHAAALASDSARDRLLPPEADCVRCHDIQAFREGRPTDPPGNCQVCHPGFDHTVHRAPEASLFLASNLVFSHRRHLERLLASGQDPNAACAACHGDVEAVELATRADLPRMATCLGCHDGRQAGAGCAVCHPPALPGRGARLETSFPSGTLRPGPGDPLGLDHGPRYDLTHSLAALSRRGQCLECHAESSCQTCHDATRKPQAIHPGDFTSTHPAAARQNRPDCSACHRLQSFCAGCHERVGVGPDAGAPFYSGAQVHPPGWLTPGPQHHGVQAARNIGQCASCHREDTCLRCHATTSAVYPGGIAPHPPGFAARCGEMLARNDRACRKCHDLANTADSAARCR
ncbi:MAG TPA: cytochrome c3 family protein [Anaeromyxobacteraceae bacterium]|nr:cytochrome c3 family protein [Anaeromyxobacteraceae bacterium]